jgi:hypothetical protein
LGCRRAWRDTLKREAEAERRKDAGLPQFTHGHDPDQDAQSGRRIFAAVGLITAVPVPNGWTCKVCSAAFVVEQGACYEDALAHACREHGKEVDKRIGQRQARLDDED